MDMLCGAWPSHSAAGVSLMYTPRQYTSVYIRSERCLCRLAPSWPRYVQGLSGRGYADLCIFIRHHNISLPDRGGTALRGDPRGPRGQSMQDRASELLRITLP